MARGEMKEAAEAVLRELPSVVGAFVREDIYGHPREVHLLVRAGPEPRALARDIRDLLEERLGVPIDQRVISIAQIAPDSTPPSPASPRPPAPAHAAAPQAPPPPDPVSAPAAERTAPASPTAPTRDSDPRLRFLGIETQVRDARVLVRARLSDGQRELVGEAVELEAVNGRARAGAATTLRAVTEAGQVHGRFELEDASLLRVFEREYVLVSAFASSPYLGRRPLTLSAAQPVELDPETAAALAALKAVNRVVALMMRMAERA